MKYLLSILFIGSFAFSTTLYSAPQPVPAASPAATPAPVDPNAEQKTRLEAIRKGSFGRTTAAILEATKAGAKETAPEEKQDDAALVKKLERAVALGQWQTLAEQLTASFSDEKLR